MKNEQAVKDRHCSICKYYECVNYFMFCTHEKLQHRIKASRKNGCKYFETMKKKIIKVSKERAIQLTMSTNGVTREMAEKYTDSELKEVLKLLKLKGDF